MATSRARRRKFSLPPPWAKSRPRRSEVVSASSQQREPRPWRAPAHSAHWTWLTAPRTHATRHGPPPHVIATVRPSASRQKAASAASVRQHRLQRMRRCHIRYRRATTRPRTREVKPAKRLAASALSRPRAAGTSASGPHTASRASPASARSHRGGGSGHWPACSRTVTSMHFAFRKAGGRATLTSVSMHPARPHSRRSSAAVVTPWRTQHRRCILSSTSSSK